MVSGERFLAGEEEIQVFGELKVFALDVDCSSWKEEDFSFIRDGCYKQQESPRCKSFEVVFHPKKALFRVSSLRLSLESCVYSSLFRSAKNSSC